MPRITNIQARKGISTDWSTQNPVLASGELGFDLTNKILKIGDGTTAWNSLSNHNHSSANISDSTTVGRALLTGADVAAQRTSLGLGTLATQSGTFSGTSSGTNTGDQTISIGGDVTAAGSAGVLTAAVTKIKYWTAQKYHQYWSPKYCCGWYGLCCKYYCWQRYISKLNSWCLYYKR